MPKTKAHKVDERSPWLAEDDAAHELATTLRKGVPAMREAAKEWQFMRPNEGELEIVPLGGQEVSGVEYEGVAGLQPTEDSEFTVYDLRVDRSTMPNVWADSIRDTARLPFRSRIVLKGWDPELVGETRTDSEGEVLEDIHGWTDNLDGEGRSLDEWAAEAFEHALFEGIVFGFVDNDPRSFPDPESRRRAGGRPYCTMLRRKDLQWLILETGPNMVPRVRAVAFAQPIREVSVEDPNAWQDESIPAIKVVLAGEELLDEAGRRVATTPVRVRVYVEQENGEYEHDPSRDAEIRPDRPEDRLLDIPLVPLYGKRLSPYRGESPYLDSATMQQAVWIQCSELQQKAREVSLGWLHESGVPGETPNSSQPIQRANPNLRYRSSTNPQARLTMVESRGEVLKELRSLIAWFTEQIQSSHNQIRSERPTAPVTAREITLEGVQASSALEMMVVFQEAGWKRILDLMVLLGGLPSKGTVEIPHDFGLPNAGIQRNHELFMVGKMTAKNHWQEKVRAGDVHETEFDLEAEIELEKAGQEMEAREAAEAIGAAIQYGASAEANAGAPPEEPEEPEAPEEGSA